MEIRISIKSFKISWVWVLSALTGALALLNLLLWVLSGDMAWLSGFITSSMFGFIIAELFTYEHENTPDKGE